MTYRILKPFPLLFLTLFTAWAFFALIGEHILLEYKKGDFLFSFSFIALLTLIWSILRFYKQRKREAFKPLLLPAVVILLALGFNFLYERPCPNVCEIKVKPLILTSEKQEFIDPKTGNKIVRLTTDPAKDSFDYYEPSHWSPDDKELKFVTTRFREKDGDPVLHMPGVIDVETGEITIYKTRYSLHWSEWSRDGRYIYGAALFKDRKLEPYFISIDTQTKTGKVLRLRYRASELPEGFDEKIGAVKDRGKITNGGWLIQGEWRTPYEALFFHLNPSGTLGGFEMYGAFGVVDLKEMESWIVGTGPNRGAFFDDRTAMISPLPINAPYAQASESPPYLVDVFTKETKPHFPGPSQCNHGNILYEGGELAKIICPGRIPDTSEGKDTLYIYNVQDQTADILSQVPEPGCCGAPSTISREGKRLAGLSSQGITVYDTETKEKTLPLSGVFRDQYLKIFGAVGEAYGGQLMISHDGQKLAFVSGIYKSKEQLDEIVELEVKCEEWRDLKEWAEEEQRTVDERQRAEEKLSRPESRELEKKCKDVSRYAPDIFVVYL